MFGSWGEVDRWVKSVNTKSFEKMIVGVYYPIQSETLNLRAAISFHFLHHMATKSQRQEHNSSLPLCQPRALSSLSLLHLHFVAHARHCPPQISH